VLISVALVEVDIYIDFSATKDLAALKLTEVPLSIERMNGFA